MAIKLLFFSPNIKERTECLKKIADLTNVEKMAFGELTADFMVDCWSVLSGNCIEKRVPLAIYMKSIPNVNKSCETDNAFMQFKTRIKYNLYILPTETYLYSSAAVRIHINVS